MDIIAAAEKEFTAKLLKDPDKASPEEHQAYFDAVKNALLSQRGIPKEQQIRELLKEYYDMRQGASERVCDFAHRFLDVQTELAKLIPNIHYTSYRNDLELQYTFAIKLRSDLQAEIISREFKYVDLQEIIQIAERYEKIHLPSNANWKPDALYSQSTANPKSTTPLSNSKTTACRYCKKDNHTSNNCFFKPASATPHLPPSQKTNAVPSPQPETTICRKYNTFHKANCELPDGSCKFNRQHKCLVCKQYKCKQLKHSAHSSVVNVQSTPEPDKTDTILQQLKQLNSSVSTISVRVSALETQTQTQTHASQTTADTVQQHNQATVDIAQPHVIGFPAVSEIQSCAVNSDPNLADKHILWTRVTSGGLSLPRSIDSCCSISLVSGAHTDHLLKTSKNLTYTPLQTPIPVSVANPTATLKATGTMEVPIIFDNNTTCTFLMLSVPGLAWPFLLGENHQQSTKAIVDHYALTITFRHPQLNTTINCQSGNPAQAFPSLLPNQNSQTAAPVTCLLTGLPTPTQLYRRIPLHRGLNFVTVFIAYYRFGWFKLVSLLTVFTGESTYRGLTSFKWTYLTIKYPFNFFDVK